jgi:hypothetical protein
MTTPVFLNRRESPAGGTGLYRRDVAAMAFTFKITCATAFLGPSQSRCMITIGSPLLTSAPSIVAPSHKDLRSSRGVYSIDLLHPNAVWYDFGTSEVQASVW